MMVEAKYLTDEAPILPISRAPDHPPDAVAQAIRFEFERAYVDEITWTTILRAAEAAMEEQRQRLGAHPSWRPRLMP